MPQAAVARLVWEVWRLTHEVAGEPRPTYDACMAHVQRWVERVLVPTLQQATVPPASIGCTPGRVAHAAICDGLLPPGLPWTAADVLPWPLLAPATQAAWAAMVAVAQALPVDAAVPA